MMRVSYEATWFWTLTAPPPEPEYSVTPRPSIRRYDPGNFWDSMLTRSMLLLELEGIVEVGKFDGGLIRAECYWKCLRVRTLEAGFNVSIYVEDYRY